MSRDLAEEQLIRFRRAVRGRIEDRALLENDKDDHQIDELWAVGQHHGLMTPLLDWTYSPFVALFFAFAQADVIGEEDNPYRAVYVLNKTFLETTARSSGIRVVEPRKDDHGRLVNQAGLFTFSPYDATIENKLTDVLTDPDFKDDALRSARESQQAEILAKYICKIYVPNKGREECLRQLRRMNVHHASLFPDLIGASQHCNVLIAEPIEPDEPSLSAATAPRPSEKKQPTGPAPDAVPPNEQSRIPEEWLRIPRPEAAPVTKVAFELNLILEEVAKDPASASARLESIVPITLRRHGYPQKYRDEILAKILQLVPAAQG